MSLIIARFGSRVNRQPTQADLAAQVRNIGFGNRLDQELFDDGKEVVQGANGSDGLQRSAGLRQNPKRDVAV